MGDALPDPLAREAVRLRASVQRERYREIAGSLTARITVEAIEATEPYLADPGRSERHPAERAAMTAAWADFRAAVAEGGEVWAFRVVGSCSELGRIRGRPCGRGGGGPCHLGQHLDLRHAEPFAADVTMNVNPRLRDDGV